jgi:hypothetical protein
MTNISSGAKSFNFDAGVQNMFWTPASRSYSQYDIN